MSDWAAGDLALCVDDGPPKDLGGGIREFNPKFAGRLRKGAIYIVERVQTGTHTGCLGLRMGEGTGGLATRFRKINPLTEEERRSFLADLPQPVEA